MENQALEQKQILWKEAVKKAFWGYLAATLFGGFLGGIFGLIFAWTIVVPLIFGIFALAGYVFYFLGIMGMKNTALGSSWGKATGNLFIGAILGLVALVIDFIPLMGWLSSIASIVGFVFSFMAFNELRKTSDDAELAGGSQLLWICAIVGIVAGAFSIIIGWIPIVGGVFAILFSIADFILAFLGWKKISNSNFTPAA